MIFSQPDRYPELKNYLSKHSVELTGKEQVWSYALLGGVMGVTSVILGAVSFVHGRMAVLLPLSAVCLTTGIITMMRAYRLSQRHEPIVKQESVAARRHIKNTVDAGGRIEHAVPFSVGMVLEECATAWRRVHDSLNGPVWKDPGLGAHWASVRDNARRAADSAMDEVLAMASPHLTDPAEAGRIRSLQQLVQRFAGTEEIEMTPLPPSFTPALATADQLRTLALEVEYATASVAQDDGLRENLQATNQISGVLGELRNLQQAEDELHRSN